MTTDAQGGNTQPRSNDGAVATHYFCGSGPSYPATSLPTGVVYVYDAAAALIRILCPSQSSFDGSFSPTKCGCGQPGTIWNAGTGSCTLCPNGYAPMSPGASSCSICPSGRARGMSVCSDGYSNACALCQPGFYASAATGASACLACGIGTVTNTTGSTACKTCPTGSFSPSTTSCYLCGRGSFSALPAVSACAFCPHGRYSARVGASSANACTACSPARYIMNSLLSQTFKFLLAFQP